MDFVMGYIMGVLSTVVAKWVLEVLGGFWALELVLLLWILGTRLVTNRYARNGLLVLTWLFVIAEAILKVAYFGLVPEYYVINLACLIIASIRRKPKNKPNLHKEEKQN